MTKNKTVLFVVALMVGAPLLAGAVFTPNAWQWKKPIALPAGVVGVGTYVKINLDQESSINGSPSLADLRVVRDGTVEVPYQVVTETTTEGKSFAPATILEQTSDKGDTVLIVDVGASGFRHNAIDLSATNQNYRRQVSLYSSDVLLSWNDPKWGWINPSSVEGANMRSTDAFIYRFTDSELGFSAQSGTVRYPETAGRYIRVVIHKENEKKEILNVSSVRTYQEVRPVVREDEMSVPVRFTENTKEQSTEVHIDLGGGGLPIKAIALATDDTANFSRRAVVHGSSDGVHWSAIGQGYIFQVRSSFFNGTQLTLTFPESAYRYLRVVVFNEDNQPVQFKGTATLRSVLRSVVFEAGMDGAYALYYGNTLAVTPRYDIGRYFQYVESISIPRVALGAQEVNPAYVPTSEKKAPFLENNKIILNGVLVLLVGIITFITIGYLKKLKLAKPHQ